VTDIDALDTRIVTLLQKNARVTNADISKQVGVSEATVRRRIEKLLDKEVIRIQAVADPFKLGYAVIVIIGLWVDKGHLEDAEKYVCSLPEVRFVGMTMGSYDIMMEAWFRSRRELVQFVTQTLAAVPGIGRSEAFEVIKLSKYTYDWGRPE
jgi:Lrp/AsnC family transcriptional regulator for asnA, asnC and gidA